MVKLDEGFIKLYRKITDSDIYKMPPLYLRVFERMVIEANHKNIEIPYRENSSNKYGKKLIKRGERLTSLRKIAEWVSWYERGFLKIPNPKTISSILKYLENENMVYIYKNGNRKETHYKIVNYSVYQDKIDNKVTVSKQSMDTNKNDKNDKKKTSSYMSDSNEYRLAVYLFKFIKRNNPKAKEADLQKWAKQFDYILRIDKRDLDEVKQVIKFCQDDDFWFKNILSPEKLRKQYDRLLLEMKKPNASNSNGNDDIPNAESYRYL